MKQIVLKSRIGADGPQAPRPVGRAEVNREGLTIEDGQTP
jgi:hypothetical protein